MAHVDEGIRDPIRCFEYMGRFYVQEGNKRVSVLKYFEAGSVTGNVTRVVPKYNDTPEVRLYYEFMHYYPLIQTYLLTFTKPGSYGRLQKAMGKGPEEQWTAEDRSAMHVPVQLGRESLHRLGRRQAARHRGRRTAAAFARCTRWTS